MMDNKADSASSWCHLDGNQRLSKKLWRLLAGICLLSALFLFYEASSYGVAVPDDFLQEIEGTNNQQVRLKILQDGCEATRSLRPNESIENLLANRSRLLNHIIVNDEHKLLYCYVPKVSSTQWKKVFGVLAGTLPANVSLDRIAGSEAHIRSKHKVLGEMEESDARQVLTDYQSFLFVRHPLERIVSAYRNKFLGANLLGYFPKHYKADILAYSGKSDDSEVTFLEFARWVSDPLPDELRKEDKIRSGGVHNEHWEPASSLCHPCVINYTWVGHQETLLPDAQYVLREANVTRVRFPQGFIKTSAGHGTKAKAPELLSKIEARVMKNLLHFYYQDFMLFGYLPESVFDGQNQTASEFVRTALKDMSTSHM